MLLGFPWLTVLPVVCRIERRILSEVGPHVCGPTGAARTSTEVGL